MIVSGEIDYEGAEKPDKRIGALYQGDYNQLAQTIFSQKEKAGFVKLLQVFDIGNIKSISDGLERPLYSMDPADGKFKAVSHDVFLLDKSGKRVGTLSYDLTTGVVSLRIYNPRSMDKLAMVT